MNNSNHNKLYNNYIFLDNNDFKDVEKQLKYVRPQYYFNIAKIFIMRLLVLFSSVWRRC